MQRFDLKYYHLLKTLNTFQELIENDSALKITNKQYNQNKLYYKSLIEEVGLIHIKDEKHNEYLIKNSIKQEVENVNGIRKILIESKTMDESTTFADLLVVLANREVENIPKYLFPFTELR